MIIGPIAIVWFEIHVTASSDRGVASNFQSYTEVISNKNVVNHKFDCYLSVSTEIDKIVRHSLKLV